MKKLKVTVTTIEAMLGSAPNDKELHETYIASKAPDARRMEEEIEEFGVDEVVEKQMTVFPRHEGKPCMYDYQIKGFFKDACGVLRKVSDKKSSKLKAYKKVIDGLIFVSPRHIPIQFEGEMGNCQRPLRASTPMGERVAIAHSEEIPAGAKLAFEVTCLADGHAELVKEWLEYGQLRGLGQWRNSGKGRFVCEVAEVDS